MAERRALFSFLALLVLSALLVGSLWVVPYLPTNDGPESILAVHIENHYADPGTLYRDVFTPAPQFAGRGFTVLFEPLEAAFGWQTGLKVALAIIVLVQAWGFVVLTVAVDPRRLPLAFLGFPLALSWSLYMGFFAFVFASSLGGFLIALTLGASPPSRLRRGTLAALLLVQAFFHMFAAVLTGVAVALVLLSRAPDRRQELRALSLTVAPAAILVVAAFLVARPVAPSVSFASGFTFLPLREMFRAWPCTLAPGPFLRALVVMAFVVASSAIVTTRALRPEASPVDRTLAFLGVAFLVTSVFAPRDVPGWQCFSERFVSPGIGLVLVLLPFESLSGKQAQPASIGIFACALGWLLSSYGFHLRLAASYDDAIAGLSAPIERRGIWLPVTLEPQGPPSVPPGETEVPFLAPLQHIGSLYATAEGGLTPYTFASNPVTSPFTLRPDAIHPPPVPRPEKYLPLFASPRFATDRTFRHAEESEVATYGMFYEGVLLTGAAPDDLALWHRRGFLADWERGSVMIGHFEPCAIDLAFPATTPEPRLDVGVGSFTLLRDLAMVPDETGGLHFDLRQGPCGRVWVKPHWDGDPAKLRELCTNLDEDGHLVGHVTRSYGRIACSAHQDAP